MVLTKKIYLIATFLLASYLIANGQEYALDSKYVKAGYVSNVALEDPNYSYLRNLGIIKDLRLNMEEMSPNQTEVLLNKRNVGKRVLDILLLKDVQGLHISNLYEIALSNVILSEKELAALNASADKTDILKQTITRQLLKNNYIILIDDKTTTSSRINWRIYHIDIDDNIIDQAYSNWDDLANYDKIKVPVSFVAQGRVGKMDNVIKNIVSKVKVLAPHAPIVKRYPFIVGFGSNQGAKLLDRVEIFRLHENKKGDVSTDKICTTRITKISSETSRLFSINGRVASKSKGDLAILKPSRRLNHISLVAHGSFGNDYRYGGRVFYERLLKLSKKGISNYILASIDYNRYCREPEGVWYPYFGAEESVRPTLTNFGANIGYSIGFMGLLGKIEIAPYVMAGFKIHLFNPDVHHVTWTGEVGDEAQPDLGFEFCGGVKANINIWYPLQLTFGGDYNFNTSSLISGGQSLYLAHHTLNRMNFFAGFRFNF